MSKGKRCQEPRKKRCHGKKRCQGRVRDLIGGIGKARRGGTGFASVFQKLVNRNFELVVKIGNRWMPVFRDKSRYESLIRAMFKGRLGSV